MDNKKKIKLSALATGTLMLGAVTAGNTANAHHLPLEDLGTGAELRTALLATASPIAFIDNRTIELKCGEGTCGEKSEKKQEAAADEKTGEHKCGEGKCGEKGEKAEKKAQKTEKKEAQAGEGKAADDKAGEHKCGEGKCGN